MEKRNKWIIIILVLFILIFIAGEMTFNFLLNNPDLASKSPSFVQHFITNVYIGRRNIIQYEPNCSRYDANYTYTLKPGRCIFSNFEFSNEFLINSLGFRDTEDAIKNPSIIVLGDSFAMGWGVNQNETYSKIIEKRLNLKTLDTGIASYGTVREVKSLDKIKDAKPKYIVIHYDNNDYDENKYFYLNGYLNITSEKKYDQLIKDYNKYFFGKNILIFYKIFNL